MTVALYDDGPTTEDSLAAKKQQKIRKLRIVIRETDFHDKRKSNFLD